MATSLLACAHRHWRSFAPAWLFPLVFFCGGDAADALGVSDAFALMAIVVFFGCFYRATRPWRKREIGYWHCVVWVLIAPFVVGVVAMLAQAALARLVAG